MKYTFLIPAYKSSFFKEALCSIQSQTYKDFLAVISDDCSPEPLYEIAKPFLSDPRFIYRKNKTNIGAEHLVNHWNLLVNECLSPYLIMASDDDYYDHTFLEEMDKLVVKYPNIELFRARLDQIDETGTTIRTEKPFDEHEELPSFFSKLFGDHPHAIGQYIFKTSSLKQLGGFQDFPLGWFSDDATAIKCSLKGSVHSSEVLFHFRCSDMNISSKKKDISYGELKLKSTLLFNEWIQKEQIVPDKLIKQRRSYWYSQIGGIWDSIPIKQRLSTLLTVPGFSFWSIRNCFNTLFR